MKNNESEMGNYSIFDTNVDRDPIYSFSFILLAYIKEKKKFFYLPSGQNQ